MKLTTLFAEKRPDESYYGFYYSRTLVEMCGADEKDIVEVVVRELQEGEESPYWGWWDNEKGEFQMIYPGKIPSDMCFPYGPEVEEEKGEGKQMNVSIEEVVQ